MVWTVPPSLDFGGFATAPGSAPTHGVTGPLCRADSTALLAGQLPDVPVYIDSPLAIAITEIYKLHPEGLRADVRRRILDRDDPFSPAGLHYVSDVAAFRALQQSGVPCIVIAGSGMCEGGRVVHHLRRALHRPEHSVVIVGFMAQHTLGRRLVERRSKVKVLGVERPVFAQVHALDGLSAHADQHDLLAFAQATARRGRVTTIALVHGEDPARFALSERLCEAIGGSAVVLAEKGKRIEL